MTQQISPFIEAKYGWDYGESGWNSGVDEDLLKFSFLFNGNIDAIVSALPVATDGSAYFLTTDSRLYFAVGTTWYSCPTPTWFQITVKATGNVYRFNGTTLDLINSPVQLGSRLDAVELTVSTLGTAAFQDVSAFATQAELDIAVGQAQAYTDALRNDLTALIAITESNINTADLLSGEYLVTVSGLGYAPINTDGYMRYVDSVNDGYAMRTYTPINSNRLFLQTKVAGAWNPWVEIYHSGNVSSYIQTLFDDADALAARTTLGACGISGPVSQTLSGTAVDFTAIPSWAKKVTLTFTGMSKSGAQPPEVRLGSGGIVSSGYLATGIVNNGGSGSGGASTTGFYIRSLLASDALTGTMHLEKGPGETWVENHMLAGDGSTTAYYGAGRVTLPGGLDAIRITMQGVTDSFDAGSVSITYEG